MIANGDSLRSKPDARPIVVFINVFGPIDHPEHGRVHEIELGCKHDGDMTIEAGKFMVKTETTAVAIISAAQAAAKFVETYLEAPKSENVLPMPLIGKGHAD